MIDYLIVAVLLLFSALFSGLTLGLMSLNAQELKRKMSVGNKDAKKVYGVRRQGNLLLTTLLIGNVAINSTLAIFLGSIASGFMAGLVATGLIVVFGEITPQAIFSRYALSLGAKMVWLVKTFIFITYPISWPIAWILNKALGEELATIYSKRELMKIMEEHEDTEHSDIDEDEERIVKGALTFSDKSVKDVMTPRVVVGMFESSQIIDKTFISSFKEASHSRIPIYEGKPDNIVGVLYLSQLLGEENIGKTVGKVADKKVFFVDEDKKLDDVFNTFLRTRHHLFVVRNEFAGMVGVITLEDILEEIIKTEIMDEADKHQDMRKLAKQKMRNKK
jgi:metal transporter CNNM